MADHSWESLKSAERKAEAEPKKYLAEVFRKGETGRPDNLDIVVVKLNRDERFKLHEAAEELGLESASVYAPWTGNKKPSPDRWVIVGRSRAPAWNYQREIERETARSKQHLPKGKASKVESKNSLLDVCGSYKTFCPYIHQTYWKGDDPFHSTLDVYLQTMVGKHSFSASSICKSLMESWGLKNNPHPEERRKRGALEQAKMGRGQRREEDEDEYEDMDD